MKKTLFALLILSAIGCKKESKTEASTTTETPIANFFPFKHNLNDFKLSKSEIPGESDCWGETNEYTKDNVKIISETIQCSEYSQNIFHYLLNKDSLNIVHHIMYESSFDEKTSQPITIASELVYDFTMNPPILFKKTDTLSKRDIKLSKKELISKELTDTNKKYSELLSQIQTSKEITSSENTEVATTFTLSQKNTIENESGAPSTEVFVTPSNSEKPIFIVKDYNLMPIDDNSRSNYNIPNSSKFAFQSWFAGGGALYYGILENKNLKIFKKFIDEGQSENSNFKLLKEIPFTETNSTIPDHYICYNGDSNKNLQIMISFQNEKALTVKYKSQKDSIKLEFENESYNNNTSAPTTISNYKEIIDNKVTGKYKLTHSGIWDYVAYTRNKDGKTFNFTINHETLTGEGYSKSPCF